MVVLATLLSCASPLAVVPNATRLAELGNGTLVVGTTGGELFALDWYGSSAPLATGLGAPVRDVAGGPLATYGVLLDDGRAFAGSPWHAPRLVADDALGILWTCDGLAIAKPDESGPWGPTVTAVGVGEACGELVVGSSSGEADGQRVTDVPIRRVQRVGAGTLWVDGAGRQGCTGCDAAASQNDVVDAIVLHVPPFLAGELAWIDGSGSVWLR
jgi:hypothetical protein